MNISYKLDPKSQKTLEKSPEAFGRGLAKGLKIILFDAEKFAKETFGKPGHIKSRTGRLRASIRAEIFQSGVLFESIRGRTIFGALGTSVEYGIYHEEGTEHIEAKPFLKPALFSTEQSSKHDQILTEAIEEELKYVWYNQGRYSGSINSRY